MQIFKGQKPPDLCAEYTKSMLKDLDIHYELLTDKYLIQTIKTLSNISNA